MSVWTLGLNHHTAPLDLRGRFSFAIEHMGATLGSLRQTLAQQSEAAILSTCNRTEIYCASAQADIEQTLHWLASTGHVPVDALRRYTYALHNGEAARHAFRVASGLDSMVLGEAQILGQMKNAVRAAEQAGTLGTTLNQMFQRSFSVAKQVRSTTDIGVHSISMAAAAVRLAAQLFEDLRRIHILFVGAGEMIELAITHFAARSPAHMVIANRTVQRGEALANRFGAQVMPLADIPVRLHEFDAIISCTASTLPIIGLGAVESAIRQRRRRPIFMVDLAVPRDIEPEVKALDDAYLYTVDDLASVVQSGQAQRQAAVAQAEVIIDEGVRHFEHWMQQRNPHNGVVGLIQQIQQQAQQWQQLELARAHKRLAKGEDAQAVLQAFSHSLTQKLLHGALAELRQADPTASHSTADVVQRIFLRDKMRYHQGNQG